MSLHLLNFRVPAGRTLRLDDFLAGELPAALERLAKGESPSDAPISFSRSKLRRLIVAGAVDVNGRQERVASKMLAAGSRVLVRLDTEKFAYERQPDDIPFELTADRILFEDESIIVIDKPAGLPTEATIVASRDHLQAAVKRYLASIPLANGALPRNEPYVGVHHRLDRETSGVILFSKTRTVNAAIHEMFLEHRAQKEYRALTARPRTMPDREFKVDNQLARISAKSAAAKWGAVQAGGDAAITDFAILGEGRNALLVLARPLTGRTHQIRVHLSGLGMPLLGDPLYGGPETFAAGDAGTIRVPRVMLHAERLTFPHPVTGVEMTVVAPIPADFQDLLGGI